MSTETPAATPKKSGKKLIVILAATVVLLGGGGAGAFWFMTKGHGDGKEAHAEKKPAKKPTFTALDPFTVNLQDARGERYAQIGITLQLADPATEAEIKDRLPTVRNEILLLIASKRIDDLLSGDGKRQLAQEIRSRTGRALGLDVAEAAVPAAASSAEHAPAAPATGNAGVVKVAIENPVQDVLFSQFIVQ